MNEAEVGDDEGNAKDKPLPYILHVLLIQC